MGTKSKSSQWQASDSDTDTCHTQGLDMWHF